MQEAIVEVVEADNKRISELVLSSIKMRAAETSHGDFECKSRHLAHGVEWLGAFGNCLPPLEHQFSLGGNHSGRAGNRFTMKRRLRETPLVPRRVTFNAQQAVTST